MPARMPARPAESPRHERVFINSGGPQGHGDSLTVAALNGAARRGERDKLAIGMMGGFWRRIGRFVLWDYPRACWQYDVMVALILAFIFLTPPGLFRDKPRPTSIVMLEGHEGLDVLWLAPDVLQGIPESEKAAKATALIAKKLGRGVTLVRLDTILDAEKEPTGYMALVKP